MGFQQGLSGLNTAAKQLDVIGNNVANAGTVGFKQSQAQFADLYAASLAGGGAAQIGTGVKLAAVAQQFSQGNVTNTNNSMDIAISGGGFFQMIDQGGAILYSRNGQFQVDKNGYMVNNQGHQVQGYQAQAGVVTAVQGPLRIDPTPLPPKQTSNLAAGGVPIGVGANVDSRAAFPVGITQGTLSGNVLPGLTIAAATPGTAGIYTAAAPMTVFDFSGGNTLDFTVDTANAVTLNANYTDVTGVVGAIQTQLDLAAGAGVYTVGQAGGAITISSAIGAAAPVVGGVVLAGTAVDEISGGAGVAGTAATGGNTLTVTVDGVAGTAGIYTAAAPMTVFDFSGGNTLDFTVDTANAVTLNANYTDVTGVVGAIQTQLDLAAGAGVYTVGQAGGAITISSAIGAAAPVVGGVVLAGTAVDEISGGAGVAGTAATGVTATVTIPVGTYTTTAALASAVQTAINADPAMIAAGKTVTVSQGASGNLVMVSNTGGPTSTIAAAGSAYTTLFGTATPVPGAGVFNPNAPDSYNNSTSLTVYDSKGTQHIATLYFQKASPNSWNTYLTIDSTVVPATGAVMATLNFDTAGRIVSVTPGAGSSAGTTNKIAISDPTYTPLGANPLPLAFDFAQTTQYGGAFGVNSLTQDGYTSGELSGFSTGTDGVISGRYTNGQSQALGQIGLVNFTNPQGLQPVGNNEWVETPQAGLVPLNMPGTSGLGLLQSSAVEDSNVDLTAELVNMITAQRVYQANAQTIKTQDAVLQTLVNLR